MKIPEGWKLVPLEPTEDMISAQLKTANGIVRFNPEESFIRDVYKAILDSSPEYKDET